MLAQVLLGPAERTATGRFALAKYAGNFGKLVLKDFAQQEGGSLEGLQLFQQQQKCQWDRLLSIKALLRVSYFI
jgi:hypothetical protein